VKRLDAALDDQHWLNHVAIADEQIECDPAQLVGRAVEATMVGAVLPETIGNEDREDGDYQRQDAEPSQGDRNEWDVDDRTDRLVVELDGPNSVDVVFAWLIRRSDPVAGFYMCV